MTRRIFAIIPASGVGSRMQSLIPKQYLTLLGKTVLEHTLSIFLEHPAIEKVVVAVSKEDHYYLKIAMLNDPKVEIVFGGETRADSVFNALQTLPENVWALVHDAARPCLKRSDLDQLLQINDDNGAILATPVIDTIKRTRNVNEQTISHTEDRSTLWHALTPQFFPAKTLIQALKTAFDANTTITDEASAMEFIDVHPQLVVGRADNIKITRPEDLALAEFYLTRSNENVKED